MSEQVKLEFPDADKGYKCPHCGQLVKRYYRNINCNMAMTMIAMFRKKKFGYIRVEEFLRLNGYPRSGDFPYLVHYGMLEKMPGKRADGSSKHGFYKLTDKGRDFVLEKIKVPKRYIIYNGVLQGFEGEEVGIKEALGKKFDYRELMDGDYTIQSR